jgi:hypothetical protein
MAILRLSEPLGDWLGYFGARVYNDSWEDEAYWELWGYPSDILYGERPTYQAGIAVIDDDSDGNAIEIEHLGDTFGGSSGGPLFGYWDDGPYVIGTHSGYTYNPGTLGIGYEDNNLAAGGNALVDLINSARTDWP